MTTATLPHRGPESLKRARSVQSWITEARASHEAIARPLPRSTSHLTEQSGSHRYREHLYDWLNYFSHQFLVHWPVESLKEGSTIDATLSAIRDSRWITGIGDN